jgi:hypothetical protein
MEQTQTIPERKVTLVWHLNFRFIFTCRSIWSLLLISFFWGLVSGSSCCLSSNWTHTSGIIFLPLPPGCSAYRCEPPYQVYFMWCWKWNPGLHVYTRQAFCLWVTPSASYPPPPRHIQALKKKLSSFVIHRLTTAGGRLACAMLCLSITLREASPH